MPAFIRRFVLILFALAAPALAAPPPAFIYNDLLNTYFHDTSGMIRFDEFDLAFAPEGEINAMVVVTNSENTVIAKFDIFAEPKFREGVFARMMVKGPADVHLTEPGVYNIILLIDGQPVTRLPVILEQTSAGDDPFNPDKKYRFFGLWQVYAYLTMNTLKDEPYPQLSLWVGGKDLPEGKSKDQFMAALKRDGKTIAHSRETSGFIAHGHYDKDEVTLFFPHTRQEIATAPPFMLSDWTEQDGDYTLEVTRQSDDQLIRRFQVTVKDGKIQHLPASNLDHEPHIDYVVPRVHKEHGQVYGFVEAIWLKSE